MLLACAVLTVVLPALVLGGAWLGSHLSTWMSSPAYSPAAMPPPAPLPAVAMKSSLARPDLRKDTPFLSLLRAPSTGIGDRFGAWANLLALALLRGDRVLLEWPDAWRKLPPSVAHDVVSAAHGLEFPPFVTLRTCAFEESKYDMHGGWQQMRAPGLVRARWHCKGSNRFAHSACPPSFTLPSLPRLFGTALLCASRFSLAHRLSASRIASFWAQRGCATAPPPPPPPPPPASPLPPSKLCQWLMHAKA